MCESTTQQQQQQQQRHLAAIRSGFPVGAFITTSDHINEVVVSLRQHGLLKTGKNVTPFDKHRRCRDVDWSPQQHDDGVDVSSSSSSSASWFAVHVSGSLPEDVKNALVPRSAIAFVSGLRILDDACQAASASVASSSSSSSTAQDAAITRTPTMASSSGQQQPVARFTFAELFAGIGMFRLAAERAGGRCVFVSEISAPPRWVYERNFGEAPSSGDITEVPSHRIPAHDILLAGFPCQSFSCAGSEAGFCDSRGMLFYEVCRVLHTKQPSAFLLENVANLVVMEEGAVLREVLTMLDACGYHVEYKVINADVVVPQHRRRVYFVGFLKRLLLGGEGGEGGGGGGGDGGDGGGGGGEERLHSSVTSLFEWPPALCSPSNATTPLRLRDVLDKDPAIASDPTLRLTQSQYEMVQGRRTPLFADVNGIFPTVMSSYRKSFQKYSLFVPVVVTAAAAEDSPQEEEGDDGSRRPPPCRFLSVRECARLQGIPETFILEPDVVSSAVGKSRCCFAPHGAYKLVGNAVCPLVVHPIIDSIVYTLEQLRGRSRREKEGVGEKEE